MNDINITSVNRADPSALETFLKMIYPSVKCDFLRLHSSWWYGGKENCWVLLSAGEIAGYSAFIPARIWLNAQETPALWWVDLVIASEYRCQGLQTLFDQRVHEMSDLLLGFPNKTAAKIHIKHHWRVREDLQIRLLPLYPSRIPAFRRFSGLLYVLIHFLIACLTPLYRVFLHLWAFFCKPNNVFPLQKADSELLAGIFYRFRQPDVTTTFRDSTHFQWRYLDAPYIGELAFYIAGPSSAPTHYLIARHLPAQGGQYPVTRVLDLFGDFGDHAAITNLLNLVKMDALQRGAVQVTLMLTRPELEHPALRTGFWLSAKSRFCWITPSKELMQILGSRVYWVLGDSDNDEPG